MIPQSVGAVAGFLALLAPGLVYQLVRGRRMPIPEDTAFREASRVALASLGFTAGGALLLSILRAVRPSLLLDPGAWLRVGKPYIQQNYSLIAGTISLQVLISCGLALGTALWLGRGSDVDIREIPTWFAYFREERPDDGDTFLMVALNSGDRFFGWIESYSTERLPADRELILRGPIQYQAAGESEPVDLGDHWSFLAISASSIDYIAIAYLEVDWDEHDAETDLSINSSKPSSNA